MGPPLRFRNRKSECCDIVGADRAKSPIRCREIEACVPGVVTTETVPCG